MDQGNRTLIVSGELERELRSSLAALDELGPAYEQEVAITLRERLRRYDRTPLTLSSNEPAFSWSWLYLPLALAMLLTAAAFMSSAARMRPAPWAVGVHREWRYHPIGGDSAPVAPFAPTAPSAVPGTY
ncbi:MAG TPA: hypothetical protein VFA70_10580 [Dehalococcoidia bacterium]|jgi:hypothetical protein|nr:hypothetical protein [Dehalococcoidia bacterium]